MPGHRLTPLSNNIRSNKLPIPYSPLKPPPQTQTPSLVLCNTLLLRHPRCEGSFAAMSNKQV